MYKLINGDCTDYIHELFEVYKDRLLIIVSDPPFNIGYKYRTYNDKMRESDYMQLIGEVFGEKPCVIIHYPEELYKIAFHIGKLPIKVVSWVYNSNNRRQHRDIAFFDVKPDFNKVRQPYKNKNDKRIKALIEKGCLGARLYDWWNINQVKNVSKEKTKHPCQMPLQVMKNIIGLLPNDAIIIDPFMGSGTTGVACVSLGLDFVGIELDSEYFEIVKKRIEEKEQELINEYS